MPETVAHEDSPQIEDSTIIQPTAEQMVKIRKILLQNRLIRLANYPRWQMVFKRRLPPNYPRWINKLTAFLDNLHQFIPIVWDFTHPVECFCLKCGEELNTVGVLVTNTIRGRIKETHKEDWYWYPNLAAYCPNCDFVIQLHETIWDDDGDDD